MTNLIAAIIIVTNSHWSVVKVEPSNVNCCVMHCDKDHSEMRTESETLQRTFMVEIPFDGKTNRFALKTELLADTGKTRKLYSGFDYIKEPSFRNADRLGIPGQWSIPLPQGFPTNFYVPGSIIPNSGITITTNNSQLLVISNAISALTQ